MTLNVNRQFIIYFKQLDSVAIQNQNANRYFKGIAGDRARQGELFGVKNMFQFRTGDQCLTLDILNASQKYCSNSKFKKNLTI